MSDARRRVEFMAEQLEAKCRAYWNWYRRACRQHGEELVSKSGHPAIERKAEDAKALRDVLAASLKEQN